MPLTLESDGQSTFDSTQALQKAKEKGLSAQLMDSFDEERQMADATRNGSVCDTAIISQSVLDGLDVLVYQKPLGISRHP